MGSFGLFSLFAFTPVFSTFSPPMKLVDPLYHKYVIAFLFESYLSSARWKKEEVETRILKWHVKVYELV